MFNNQSIHLFELSAQLRLAIDTKRRKNCIDLIFASNCKCFDNHREKKRKDSIPRCRRIFCLLSKCDNCSKKDLRWNGNEDDQTREKKKTRLNIREIKKTFCCTLMFTRLFEINLFKPLTRNYRTLFMSFCSIESAID